MRDLGTWQDACHKWSCKLQSPTAFVCLWVRDSRVAVQDLYLNDFLQLWLLYTGMLCLCPEAEQAVPSEHCFHVVCISTSFRAKGRWSSPLHHACHPPCAVPKDMQQKTGECPCISLWIVKSEFCDKTLGTSYPLTQAVQVLQPVLCHLHCPTLEPILDISLMVHVCPYAGTSEQWAGWIRGALELGEGHQNLSRE